MPVSKSKLVVLPCDCKCCSLVIEKIVYDDGEINYNISMQDSRYDHNYNTFLGRLKRAAYALFGKPVYFNDLYITDTKKYSKLIDDMSELLDWHPTPEDFKNNKE